MPAALALLLARAPLDVPIDLGREEAQRLARLELAKPAYSNQDPWIQRVMSWIIERVGQLLDNLGGTSPLGWFGILGIAVIVVLVVVVIRRRTGGLGQGAAPASLFDGAARSATEFRREAARYAESGAWAEAVRARLRAVVRDLEERGLVDAQPGRTADEIARDAGRALPSVSADLRLGARLFDDVWYGGRTADASTYARLVAVDDAVASARPDRTSRSDGPALMVPR